MSRRSKKGELERWVDRVPERPTVFQSRYPQPAFGSKGRQQDRQNEADHAVGMRQLARKFERDEAQHLLNLREIARDGELDRAEANADLDYDLDQVRADLRLVGEIKWSLFRTKKESEILAAGDTELAAKFAVLDDEFFQRRRLQAFYAFQEGRPQQ